MRAHLPPFSATTVATMRHPVESARKLSAAIDCYCGLGPDCELFRKMTPDQRAACTRDKRATAQSFFRNGLHA
jgi:hypothetical protein